MLKNRKRKGIILTRTACLGNYSVARIKLDQYEVINHQKNRIDYCLNIHERPEIKANAEKVSSIINDEFDVNIIEMEERDIFAYKNVKMLIMDSFAELTDKMFVECNKYGEIVECFTCHYQDVNIKGTFYTCQGELPIEDLERCYRDFFEKIWEVYGNISIVYIEFPYVFETRKEYIRRAQKIGDIVRKLEKEYAYLQVIELHDVEGVGDFAYHFTEKTFTTCAHEIVNKSSLRLVLWEDTWRYRIKQILKKLKCIRR